VTAVPLEHLSNPAHGRLQAWPNPPASRRFRDVMGCFATGVAVLTVRHAGTVHASTVNSLTSVSLRPAMLLVCVRHDGTSARLVRASERFGLTILSHRQAAVAVALSDARRATGSAQLAGVSNHPGRVTGVPLLDGAIAWVECAVERIVDGGDHDVVMAHVLDLATGSAAAPLTFFRGRYGRLEPDQ
jgi:flavin reductase (DIM6/NTAB) family NADH-FMN oxidoreductase RutF